MLLGAQSHGATCFIKLAGVGAAALETYLAAQWHSCCRQHLPNASINSIVSQDWSPAQPAHCCKSSMLMSPRLAASCLACLCSPGLANKQLSAVSAAQPHLGHSNFFYALCSALTHALVSPTQVMCRYHSLDLAIPASIPDLAVSAGSLVFLCRCPSRPQVMRRYHIQDRDDYKKYNKLVGMVTKLVATLKRLDPTDATRIELTEQLLNK